MKYASILLSEKETAMVINLLRHTGDTRLFNLSTFIEQQFIKNAEEPLEVELQEKQPIEKQPIALPAVASPAPQEETTTDIPENNQ